MPAPGRANITVGILTFNRPADQAYLRPLTSDPLQDNVIGAVIVADQGKGQGQGPSGIRGLPLHSVAGCRCTTSPTSVVLGYSRVMLEALRNTDCEQILFMDDDTVSSRIRSCAPLALSWPAKTPTLGSAARCSTSSEPCTLHVMGEVVDRQLHVDQRPAHRVRP